MSGNWPKRTLCVVFIVSQSRLASLKETWVGRLYPRISSQRNGRKVQSALELSRDTVLGVYFLGRGSAAQGPAGPWKNSSRMEGTVTRRHGRKKSRKSEVNGGTNHLRGWDNKMTDNNVYLWCLPLPARLLKASRKSHLAFGSKRTELRGTPPSIRRGWQ